MSSNDDPEVLIPAEPLVSDSDVAPVDPLVSTDETAATESPTPIEAPVSTELVELVASTEPPQDLLAVSAPSADSLVSGSMFLSAIPAVDGAPIAVKWFVDDVEIGHDDDGAPWFDMWDTWTHDNGPHEIFAKSLQPSGEWSTSPVLNITINNPTERAVSGEPAPVGDLPGWNQSFLDDFVFDIPVGGFPDRVSSHWDAYPSPWNDTSGNGVYSPERVVSIEDGTLRKYLHTEDGQHLVAALLPKVEGSDDFGTLYGRYSIRFRSDDIAGYKIAWLLWPDEGTNITGSASGVGGNGELNFPEMDLDSDDVNGFVHFQDAIVGNDQYVATAEDIDIAEWHTYTMEWTPDLVVMFLDGVEVGRTTERIPNTSMHWVIQTETSLVNETSDGPSGVIEIDWVAAWAYDPESADD